jgi:hypothetical protein
MRFKVDEVAKEQVYLKVSSVFLPNYDSIAVP